MHGRIYLPAGRIVRATRTLVFAHNMRFYIQNRGPIDHIQSLHGDLVARSVEDIEHGKADGIGTKRSAYAKHAHAPVTVGRCLGQIGRRKRSAFVKMKNNHDVLPFLNIFQPVSIDRVDDQRSFNIRHAPVTRHRES